MQTRTIQILIICLLILSHSFIVRANSIQGYYLGYNLETDTFTLLELFESDSIKERKTITLLDYKADYETYNLKILDKQNNITKEYLIIKNKKENANNIKILKINKDKTTSKITSWDKLKQVELD